MRCFRIGRASVLHSWTFARRPQRDGRSVLKCEIFLEERAGGACREDLERYMAFEHNNTPSTVAVAYTQSRLLQ